MKILKLINENAHLNENVIGMNSKIIFSVYDGQLYVWGE